MKRLLALVSVVVSLLSVPGEAAAAQTYYSTKWFRVAEDGEPRSHNGHPLWAVTHKPASVVVTGSPGNLHVYIQRNGALLLLSVTPDGDEVNVCWRHFRKSGGAPAAESERCD